MERNASLISEFQQTFQGASAPAAAGTKQHPSNPSWCGCHMRRPPTLPPTQPLMDAQHPDKYQDGIYICSNLSHTKVHLARWQVNRRRSPRSQTSPGYPTVCAYLCSRPDGQHRAPSSLEQLLVRSRYPTYQRLTDATAKNLARSDVKAQACSGAYLSPSEHR